MKNSLLALLLALPSAAFAAERVPSEPGQSAFAALQEVVQVLDDDTATDWSKVDIAALREHLVDMDEVTLHAAADTRDVPGGFEARVHGDGRTGEAVRRMVPAHAHMLDGFQGLKAALRTDGEAVVLTVTTDDAARVTRLRALGFFGVMTLGAHHQMHHLMIAKGEHPHHH